MCARSSAPAPDLQGSDRGHHPQCVARARREAAQGHAPRRVPSAHRRRRGPPAEDARGAAGQHGVHRARRPGAPSWSPSPRAASASSSPPIDESTITRRAHRRGPFGRGRPRPAAAAAAGNLDRARVLVTDPGLPERRAAFAAVPVGSTAPGSRWSRVVRRAQRKLIDQAAASLAPVHAAEVADLDERVAAVGERGSGRKTLEDATSASIGATAPTSCAAASP
jgi:hypothetical protein